MKLKRFVIIAMAAMLGVLIAGVVMLTVSMGVFGVIQ